MNFYILKDECTKRLVMCTVHMNYELMTIMIMIDDEDDNDDDDR